MFIETKSLDELLQSNNNNFSVATMTQSQMTELQQV